MKNLLRSAAAVALLFAWGCPGIATDLPGEEHVHGDDGGMVMGGEDGGMNMSSDAGDGGMNMGSDAGDGGMNMGSDAGPSWFDGGVRPDGGVSLDSIPSNFDAGPWLDSVPVPPSGVPDNVGAFRFICNPSHLSYDDPIVYPGQPKRAHLHQFFGNTLADAYSTYDSLRTTGESTCENALNRSAYWMPAMMNGKGKVVRPDYVSIYYKRYPKTSPRCQIDGTACVNLPRGLRYVFGYNMNSTTQSYIGWFNCDGTGLPADAGVVSAHFDDIPAAAKNCPIGAKLGAIIEAPHCWNGRDLDSPDHRSHMAYPAQDGFGNNKCPATHPYIVPTFTLGAWYSVDADLDRSGTWVPGVTQTWHFSSDVMPNMTLKPGTSFHSDWFGAWDDDVMAMWSDNCIDKLLNCSGGNLGNGFALKRWPGFSWTANPHAVDPPDAGP